jgi:sugar (pentulose or hexulose) kinase
LPEAAAELLYETVGRWPGPIHTAPRLVAEPKVSTFLPLSDWLLYRLSGVKAVEPAQAAESCLFSVSLNLWSSTAIQAFGLADRNLPALKRPGQFWAA